MATRTKTSTEVAKPLADAVAAPGLPVVIDVRLAVVRWRGITAPRFTVLYSEAEQAIALGFLKAAGEPRPLADGEQAFNFSSKALRSQEAR